MVGNLLRNPSDPVKVQIALHQAKEDLRSEKFDTESRYDILLKRATFPEEKNRLEQEKSIKLETIQDQMDEITLKLTDKH